MKKLKLIAAAAVLFICLAPNVRAQEASFEDETLINLKRTSEAALKGIKLRIVTVEEKFEDGNAAPLEIIKSVNEILPPDRSRDFYETKTARGIEREEYIDIGEKRFVRRNDGDWEIFVPNGSGMGGGTGNGSGIMPKIETTEVKTLVKGETVNNQKADLYKTVVTRKYTFPDKTYTNVFAESFWFDSQGRILKSVADMRYGEAKKSSRTTAEYDYNPNLKIVQPRVKNKAKVKQ